MESTTWRRRLTTALATAAAVVPAVLAGGPVATAVAACPNEALRVENHSTTLPDCRAYELVSPVFKEGFASTPTGFTDDGRLAYVSNGNFAGNGLGTAGLPGGNQYVAVRSASGWSTSALAPSGPDYHADSALPQLFSRDLRSSVWAMSRGDQVGVSDLYLRRSDDVFTRIGSAGNPLAPPTLSAAVLHTGASDDLSHVIFTVGANDVYPGTVPASVSNLYEYVGTGHEDQPRLVSVNNAGQQIGSGCDVPVGDSDSSTYHAISTDGRVIFFDTKCVDATQVWARVNGTTTIAVSASECTRAPADPGGACSAAGSAMFQGANADGTRVYFTTSQQLVDGDTDATNDLYECDIPAGTPPPVGTANPCPDLREVSGAAVGADVQGVTRISDDGSRAYFVATGVLASNPGANDARAVAGDENLYVWHRDVAHPAGETRFVAKLDPADGATPGLWNADKDGRFAQTTDDGRDLVFLTYAALIDHGPQTDTDTARDVYRYDAETGGLTRLSTDTDGGGGNEPGHDAQFTAIFYPDALPSYRPRGAMTDDGGSVVFTTDEALAPNDTNGTIDSYLWHDGRVSLISSGEPSDDSLVGARAWIAPSGRDVYFTTTAQLTPSDVDTVPDIYDARIDGGFDVVAPVACADDACQGNQAAPPAPSSSGTTSPSGEVEVPQAAPTVTVLVRRNSAASTGRLPLTIGTNVAGALAVKATATLKGHSVPVGAEWTAIKAGTTALSLTLSKALRKVLATSGRATAVKIAVTHSKVSLPRSITTKVTHKKRAKTARSSTASERKGRTA